jgi:alpha-galactosidase/6-phospho-beta-glucosidase family protein
MYGIYPLEQDGGGIGDIFRSVYRRAIPIASDIGKFVKHTAAKAGKSLLKTGLSTATKFLGDISSGQKIGPAARKRVSEAQEEIQQKVSDKLKRMQGAGRRRRRVGRRVKRRRKVISHHPALRKRRSTNQQGGGARKRRRATKVVRKRKTVRKTRVRRRRRRADLFN